MLKGVKYLRLVASPSVNPPSLSVNPPSLSVNPMFCLRFF